MKTLKIIPVVAAGAALIGLSTYGLPLTERAMIYHPDAAGQFRDVTPPAPWERVAITDAATGVDIFAWYIPARPGHPMTLWLHGNADSVEGMRGLSDMIMKDGDGALLVSYRGYAGNPGAPSEEGLTRDARAGLDWLVDRGHSSISIVAHSLGTGVAAGVAALDGARHVEQLVLFAPFTDLPSVAQSLMPFAPTRLLMTEIYPSRDHLESLPDLPVLIVHGTEDRVVPVEEGKRLAASLGDRGEILLVEGAGHLPFTHDAMARVRAYLEITDRD